MNKFAVFLGILMLIVAGVIANQRGFFGSSSFLQGKVGDEIDGSTDEVEVLDNEDTVTSDRVTCREEEIRKGQIRKWQHGVSKANAAADEWPKRAEAKAKETCESWRAPGCRARCEDSRGQPSEGVLEHVSSDCTPEGSAGLHFCWLEGTCTVTRKCTPK